MLPCPTAKLRDIILLYYRLLFKFSKHTMYLLLLRFLLCHPQMLSPSISICLNPNSSSHDGAEMLPSYKMFYLISLVLASPILCSLSTLKLYYLKTHLLFLCLNCKLVAEGRERGKVRKWELYLPITLCLYLLHYP